jgi:predicted N-formylglutamate amidohydrolase
MIKAKHSTERLLGPFDPSAVGVRNGTLRSPFLLICDHAGNAVPKALNNLGLPRSELDRHIGIDIGILGVSEVLADVLAAPLVFQRYSRLVIECNRLYSSPDSIALISDGTMIPLNAEIDDIGRSMRIDEITVPYHNEITSHLDRRIAMNTPTILLSMHSFTPSLLARPACRPWHVGLCYDADVRFTNHVLAAIEKMPDINVGRNEPYGVDMSKDYSIPVHAEARKIPYAEFEVRQDLIATAEGQKAWGERLATVVREAYAAYGEAST